MFGEATRQAIAIDIGSVASPAALATKAAEEYRGPILGAYGGIIGPPNVQAAFV